MFGGIFCFLLGRSLSLLSSTFFFFEPDLFKLDDSLRFDPLKIPPNIHLLLTYKSLPIVLLCLTLIPAERFSSNMKMLFSSSSLSSSLRKEGKECINHLSYKYCRSDMASICVFVVTKKGIFG